MIFNLSGSRSFSLLGILGLVLTLSCETAYSQTGEAPVPAEETSAPEPNLEEQLIKSLLRVRQLEGELKIAKEKAEDLSALPQAGKNGEVRMQSEYLPRNGREEVCILSVIQALRNDDVSIDWKSSCGEKLISKILFSTGSQQSSPGAKQDTISSSLPEGQGPGQIGDGASPAADQAAQQLPKEENSTEPYTIFSVDDGKTPLMQQQREVARMKIELLPSTECIEAGKWLMDAAKDDLLLFSFFAVDRDQIGRCVLTNAGWRFERAGPFDEGYVLQAKSKS
jgi:hypothetical protein